MIKFNCDLKMRKAVINKMMNFVSKDSYSKEELEKIRYGFEVIYIFITKGIIVFLIAYFLGILKYTLAFLGIYSLLRAFACGLHASKGWICTISSILIFIIIPYLCKILVIDLSIRITLMILSTILIFIYAPADTKKRPIINKKKRLRLKITSTLISIIYIIISFYIEKNFILNAIMFGMLLETIMILPITYKTFKLPYNNYINYIKVHNLEGRI